MGFNFAEVVRQTHMADGDMCEQRGRDRDLIQVENGGELTSGEHCSGKMAKMEIIPR